MLENKILATFDTGVTYYLRLLIIFWRRKNTHCTNCAAYFWGLPWQGMTFCVVLQSGDLKNSIRLFI